MSIKDMSAPPRPRRGVHLLPLDPGAVLFCEASQNLYALNGAAALVWCALEDGFEESEIGAALVEAGATVADAPGWYGQSLEMFGLRGLLAGTTALEPPPVKTLAFGQNGDPIAWKPYGETTLFLAVFDSLIALRLADAALRPAMEDIFDRLIVEAALVAPDRSVDVTVDIGRWEDGWVATRAGLLAARGECLGEIVREIERGVIQLAVERTAYLMEFRAALMTRRGKGFLFAGPSGSAKSTLAAGLMHRGWGFGSDDGVLMRGEDFRFRAAPKSLRLHRGSWPVLAPLFGEIETAAVHGRSDRPVRYLKPHGEITTEAAVGGVVFTQYRRAGPSALTPLSRPEGLQELFANCASVPCPLALADVAALVAWSEGVEFHRLQIADLGEALDLLARKFG